MNPNRIVTVLTPVFAGLAGSLSVWMAENLPGAPQVGEEGLTAIFVAGATSATAAAWKWLQGWQRHEERLSFDTPMGDGEPWADVDGSEDGPEPDPPALPVVEENWIDGVLNDPSIARLEPGGPLSELVEQLRARQ